MRAHHLTVNYLGDGLRDAADLYLFPNAACALLMTGEQIADWLERSAGMFNQVTPGSTDQALLNPEFPSYNFDVIDGVTYEIDLSAHPRWFRRITSLRFDPCSAGNTHIVIEEIRLLP